MRSAGTTPNRMPVSTETPIANASTGRSIDTSRSRGNACGNSTASSFRTPDASAMPAIPLISESTTDSVSSCHTISLRLAPSAPRSAISPLRRELRTSSSPATFTHAISSTSATAPNNTSSTGRVFPTWNSSCGITVAVVNHLLLSGNCAANPRATLLRSAFACSTVTPGFNRPMISSPSWLRCFVAGETPS